MATEIEDGARLFAHSLRMSAEAAEGSLESIPATLSAAVRTYLQEQKSALNVSSLVIVIWVLDVLYYPGQICGTVEVESWLAGSYRRQ